MFPSGAGDQKWSWKRVRRRRILKTCHRQIKFSRDPSNISLYACRTNFLLISFYCGQNALTCECLYLNFCDHHSQFSCCWNKTWMDLFRFSSFLQCLIISNFTFVIFKNIYFIQILTVYNKFPFCDGKKWPFLHVCVFMKLQQTCKSASSCCLYKGKRSMLSSFRVCTAEHSRWYIYILFFDIIVAKLVFKLELSKYVYCTLVEVYTGAHIQPKVCTDFHKHFL